MIFYRVQSTQDKRGPYRFELSPLWKDEGHDERNEELEITVVEDVILPDSSKWKAFAFRSKKQLMEWFSKSELKRLKKLGFVVAKVNADKVIYETKKEVVIGRTAK